jgi:predicted lipid-binding transport protein (Tim44 family)
MSGCSKWLASMTLLWVGLFATQVHAQQLYVYPAKGQSQQQQTDDEAACYHYGVKQSGFDPMQVPTATSPEPQTKGSAGGGLLKGALLGTAIGAITGDTGEGAAIGAVAGGLFGGMRNRQSREQQQQWANQQAANYAQNRSNYNRAYAACLEGRGYTVD